jgi:hypothetical protein
MATLVSTRAMAQDNVILPTRVPVMHCGYYGGEAKTEHTQKAYTTQLVTFR